MRMQLQAPMPLRRARTDVERPHPAGSARIVALRLAGGAVALWGLLTLLGLLVTQVLTTGSAHRADLRADLWFAAHRTGLWNDVTLVGTSMAQTQTAIAVTVVVVLFLRWRLGRWHESGVLGSGDAARRPGSRWRCCAASPSSSGCRGCTGGCTTRPTSWPAR